MQKSNYFIEYTPVKDFNDSVQSAIKACRQDDENPNFSVGAETMILLGNSWHVYQILDRNGHSVAKEMNVEKTHSAIINKTFKTMGHINDQLYEDELAKSEIEHKEPIIVGFSILQYTKLRMLQLYYNFFYKPLLYS